MSIYPRRATFHLVHYFAVSSFIAFVVVALLLGRLYKRAVMRDLIALGESKNIAITRTFANSQWSRFASFVKASARLSKDELQHRSEIERLHQVVHHQMSNVGVVKIKLYNLDGLTIFSTDPHQIGEQQAQNPAFQAAKQGDIVSDVVWRDQVHALDETVRDRSLIFTYLPIIHQQTGEIEGVFEIYSDVSEWLARIRQTQRMVFTAILLILTGLYLVLFFIVRHESGIIQAQSRELHKLSQAVEQSAHGIMITDAQGAIEYVNPKFSEMSGYTDGDLVGQSTNILNSGTHSRQFYQQLWDTIKAGHEWSGEFCNKRKNGELYWEYVTISPIYDESGVLRHFIAMIENISDRKHAEAALRESDTRFRKVIEHDVDAIIVVDEDNLVRFANPAAEQLFQIQERTLVGKHFGIPVIEGKMTELEIPREDGSFVVVEIQTVKIEWENEPAYLESLRDITEHKRIENALRESQQQLEASYQREYRRRQLSDTLREIARIVGSTLEQQEVLTLIFSQLDNVITYHRATVSLLEDEELILIAGRDKTGESVGRFTYPAYRYPLNAQVLSNKRPILIPDVTADERWHSTDTMARVRSFINAPLLVQDEPIGLLAVSRRDAVPYTEDDAETVFAFASQVALSMHNAQLYAAMQARNRRLALLHQISLAMNSTLDLHTLLTATCRELVVNFHCDHSGVLLYDDHYMYGEVVAEYPHRNALGIQVPLDGYAAAEQLRTTQEPLAIYDAQQDPLLKRVWPVMRSLDIQSILIVPLITKDQVIGSFGLDLVHSQHHFAPSEIKMAQTVASQLAISIENARWVEKERQRMEEELTTAWQIQTSLLPVNVPDVSGLDIAGFSHPARRVGGDFFNYYHFTPQRLGVAVGDVAGKGMRAALMMALSVGLLTTKVHKEMSPAELLFTLNNELLPHMQRNWMNTAFSYATLQPSEDDHAAWELRAANAALVAPLLCRRDRQVEWIDLSGLPLGMTENITYEEGCYTLATGDMLIFSSDGITEAENGREEMYGAERLAQCVASVAEHPAEVVLNRVLEDVRHFVGEAEATDDLTMVVVKVVGK